MHRLFLLLPLLLAVSSGVSKPETRFQPNRYKPEVARQQADSDRVDCHPDADADEDNCLARGCLFQTSAVPGMPWCYYPPDFGYIMYGQPQLTESGFLVELVKSGPPSFAPEEFNFVMVEVEFQTDERLRVKIHPNTARYEVPITIPTMLPPPTNPFYSIEISDVSAPVFSFRILRSSTGAVLFDSALGGLTLADQFLQVAARLPNGNVYGLGEHEHPSFRHDMEWKTWAMFANDWAPNPDAGLYGVHPHYTLVEDDGNVHSVLFLNSNAQEVEFTPAPGIIYRTIGGVLDMYFFLGPTPESSVQQYTEAVGRAPLPAYWTLGFHLCRWGYPNTESMIAAHTRTVEAGIPLEAQWGDIDVMDRKLDFTYDTVAFSGLPAFIDELHSNDRRFVVIVDPGVPTGEPEGSYPAFEDGMQNGVWVLDAAGQPLLGNVWPDSPVHYPDFSNMATHDWWTRSVDSWHQLIAFDGLWIDMNEPSNFVTGSTTGCGDSKYNLPPYVPKFGRTDINEKTICMDSSHNAGLHYDTHSMYGWWETIATRKAVRQVTGERGLVLSRSTFPGSGHHAAHWLGDNFSEWDNLKFSIIGMLEFNHFGIPMVGADICGFNGDTNEELCARWQLLGAFYPFSRNHNTIGALDQDPGSWPSVAENARNSLRIRYSLLPYLYTLFYHHSMHGGTVARPLWHEFPQDQATWGIDEQFLWGSSFLISPALLQGQTVVTAYLPQALWYDYHTRQAVETSGGFIDIDCPIDFIPLHVRGGAILPTQAPEMTTTASRLNNFDLLAALDSSGAATGDLYWDDGITVDDDLLMGSHISYSILDNVLTSNVVSNAFATDLKVSKVAVWGVDSPVTDVVVNDGDVDCDWSHGADMVLEVDCGEQLDVVSQWSIRWQ